MLARKKSNVAAAAPGGQPEAAEEAAELPRKSGAAPGSFRVRYSLGPLLGKGAFGTVYACTRRGEVQGRSSLAVKMIAKKPSDGHTGAAQGRAEAELMRQMSAHPESIVQLVEWLEDETTVYLVMERCKGGDLHRIVQHCGKVAEPTACSILRQLATAVAHCHTHHILHRDINTRNIFVASEIDLEGRTGSSEGAAAAECGAPAADEPLGDDESEAAGDAEDASSDHGSASGAPMSPRSAAPTGAAEACPSPGLAVEGPLRHQHETKEQPPLQHGRALAGAGEDGQAVPGPRASGKPTPGQRREESKSERRQALRQLHKLLEQEHEGLPETDQEGGRPSGPQPTPEPSGGLVRRASLGSVALREAKSPRGRGSIAAGGVGSGQSPLAVMHQSLSASSATSSSSSSFTSFSSSASASSAAPSVSGTPSLLLGIHGAHGYDNSSPGLERVQGRAVLAKLDEAAAYNGHALGAAPESHAREGAQGSDVQRGLQRVAVGEVSAGVSDEQARQGGLGKSPTQVAPGGRLVSPQLGGSARDWATLPSIELGTREPPALGAVFASRRARQRGAFEGDIHIKLADFGLSKLLSPSKPYTRGMKGARSFRAPEVVKGHRYGVSADVWSMGVVFCVMLTGRAPFHGVSKEDHAGLRQSILRARVDFAHPVWGGISPGAKELVRLLLEPDPRRRITAESVANHPFVCQGLPKPGSATPASLAASLPLVRMDGREEGKEEGEESLAAALRRDGRPEEGGTPTRRAAATGARASHDGRGGSQRMQARERGLSSPLAGPSSRGAAAAGSARGNGGGVSSGGSARGNGGGVSSGGSLNSAGLFWGLLRPTTPEPGHPKDLAKARSLRRTQSRGHAAQPGPGEAKQGESQRGRARGHESTPEAQRQHPGAPPEWSEKDVPESLAEPPCAPESAAGAPASQEGPATASQSGHLSVVTRDDLAEESKGGGTKEAEEEGGAGGAAPVPGTSAASVAEGIQTGLLRGTAPVLQAGGPGDIGTCGGGVTTDEEVAHADGATSREGNTTGKEVAHAGEAAPREGSSGMAGGEAPMGPVQGLPPSVDRLVGESDAGKQEPGAASGQGSSPSSQAVGGGVGSASPPRAGPMGPQSPASSAASTSGVGEAGSAVAAAPKRRAKKSSVCEIVAETEVAPPLYQRRTRAGDGHSSSLVDASPQTASMFGLGMTTPQGTHSGVHEETKLPMAYRRRTGPGTSFNVNTAPFPQATSLASASLVHAETKLPMAYQRRTAPGTGLGSVAGAGGSMGTGRGLDAMAGGEASGAGSAEEPPRGADTSGRRHPLAPRSNTVHAQPSSRHDGRQAGLVALSVGGGSAELERASSSSTLGSLQVPEGQLLTWNNDTAAYLWRKDSARNPLSASSLQGKGSGSASFVQRREIASARGTGEASLEARAFTKSASAGSRNELRAVGTAPRRRNPPQEEGNLSEVESSGSRRGYASPRATRGRTRRESAEQGAGEGREAAGAAPGASARAGERDGARRCAPGLQRDASSRDAHHKAPRPARWTFLNLSHSFSSKDAGRQRAAAAAVSSSGPRRGPSRRGSGRVTTGHESGSAASAPGRHTAPGRRSSGAGTGQGGMASGKPRAKSAAGLGVASKGAAEGVPAVPQILGDAAPAAGHPGGPSRVRPSVAGDPDRSLRVEQEGGIVAQVLRLGVKSQSEVLPPRLEVDPSLTRQASGVSQGRRGPGSTSSTGGSRGRVRSGRHSTNPRTHHDPEDLDHLRVLEHAHAGAQWRAAGEGKEWAGALPQSHLQGSSPERSWGYASLSHKKVPQEPQGSQGSGVLAAQAPALSLGRHPLGEGTSWASTSSRSSGGARTGAAATAAGGGRPGERGGWQRRGWGVSPQGGSLSGTPRDGGQSVSSMSTAESRPSRETTRTSSFTKVKRVTSSLVSAYLLNE